MSACVRLCTCLYIYVRYLRYLFVWHFGVKLWACVWRVCMCVCVSIKLNETLCTNGRHIWFAVILFFDVAYLYVENTMICRRYGSHENWISMTTNYRSINGSHQFIEFKKKKEKKCILCELNTIILLISRTNDKRNCQCVPDNCQIDAYTSDLSNVHGNGWKFSIETVKMNKAKSDCITLHVVQ